jgi:lipid-A-disaccharide synthase
MNGLKYYIIAGEASGDLHGSLLVSALKQCDSNSQFRAWGGDLMQKQGVFLAKHVQELSIMGIIQVILKIFQIWRLFRFCFKDIQAFNPDALILIDYSGFNLRVAEWASKKGIPVYYYISPQVWASRSHRVEKIRKHVRKLFVIFPFEKEFYKKKNIDVRKQNCSFTWQQKTRGRTHAPSFL